MKLLNLACGNCRPQSEEWLNVDNLHDHLAEGTPERTNLNAEKNYRNRDIVRDGLSPEMEECDGILLSHCVEHWTCQEAAFVMKECLLCLKPQGILMVSVPDANYFRQVHGRDTVENAVELFGEPIHLPDGEETFCGYALWNRHHKAIITETVLWHYFLRAGFHSSAIYIGKSIYPDEKFDKLQSLLNREKFSLVMSGMKSE